MKCPICGGIDVGKISKKVYFCWHCLLEIQIAEQKMKIYAIDEDGGLQWFKKYPGYATGDKEISL